jgi:hypothetical protein
MAPLLLYMTVAAAALARRGQRARQLVQASSYVRSPGQRRQSKRGDAVRRQAQNDGVHSRIRKGRICRQYRFLARFRGLLRDKHHCITLDRRTSVAFPTD